MEIILENCVADAFYSVANMKGHYKGLQAKFKEALPKHFYTLFYAHVLN